jgi:hypothetical protein
MDATQQKGSPKQLRGRSLGTKLSEAEYAVAAATEKSAARRGQTLSEWCRQALLDAVAGPAPRPEAETISQRSQVMGSGAMKRRFRCAGALILVFPSGAMGFRRRLLWRPVG